MKRLAVVLGRCCHCKCPGAVREDPEVVFATGKLAHLLRQLSGAPLLRSRQINRENVGRLKTA